MTFKSVCVIIVLILYFGCNMKKTTTKKTIKKTKKVTKKKTVKSKSAKVTKKTTKKSVKQKSCKTLTRKKAKTTATSKKTKTKKSKEPEVDLYAVLKRKHILCHTCVKRTRCEDAIKRRYPIVCMIYEADKES